jgi:hypothetical protein
LLLLFPLDEAPLLPLTPTVSAGICDKIIIFLFRLLRYPFYRFFTRWHNRQHG